MQNRTGSKNLKKRVPNLRCPENIQQLNFLKMPDKYPLNFVPVKVLQFRDFQSVASPLPWY